MGTVVVVVIGSVAAIALLAIGYRIGLARNERAQADLRAQLDAQRDDFRAQVEQLTRSIRDGAAMQQVLENEVKEYLTAGAPSEPERFRSELDVILRQLVEAERSRSEGLRDTMHELFQPLLHRERVAAELQRLHSTASDRSRLPVLIDNIARTGGFSVVLLSDEAGLPLAVSTGTEDAEHHAGLASMLMILVERLGRVPGKAPVAIALYDEANEQTLCRIFEVSGQRLMLSALASGETLSPRALEPALTELEAVLSTAD